MAYNLLSEDSKKLIENADILKQSFVVEEEGCNGSILPSLFAVLTLGFGILAIRRRRGDYNEEN